MLVSLHKILYDINVAMLLWGATIVGSLKLCVSFAKEPYKKDDILQKRPMILRSLLIVATQYAKTWSHVPTYRSVLHNLLSL